MNWDLGNLLMHLEVLAVSDSGLGSLSKINFHACSQPPCNTLCYAISSCSLFRIVDSKQPYLSASICPLLFEGRERKTHKKGKPIINPIQKNRFPTVLFRLMIGIRPTAIIGNWTIYQSATTLQRVGQLTCIKNRYGLIFFDTTAITNS
jgi:hypothetical protein